MIHSEPCRAVVRPMTLDDIPAVVELQKRVFPGMTPWSPELLARHLSIFPEGQLVAIDENGRAVGSSSSLIIDWDDYADSAKWSLITGDGTFETHNPLGKTLYGADIGVDPLARRRGVGTLLYEARKNIVRKLGLKRLLAGGRIPGYAQVSAQMTPRQYVTEVIEGKRKDPTLSFQIDNGFVVLDVIADYLHDAESRNFATLLEWLNPEYTSSVGLAVFVTPHRLFRGLRDSGSVLRAKRRELRLPIRAVPRIFHDAAAELFDRALSGASRAPPRPVDARIRGSLPTAR